MSKYLKGISQEFKRQVGFILNTNSNVADIKEEYELTYDNGFSICEWAFKYSNVDISFKNMPRIKCFQAKSGSWNFPLIIDYENGIVFTLMKESNINAKRKSKKIPLHYAKKLSKINKSIYSQQTLMLDIKQESNYEILKSVCSDITIEDVPKNLLHVVITFSTHYNEVKSIKANLFDEQLLLIEPSLNWDEYIDTDYPRSASYSNKTAQQIEENNAKLLEFKKEKESLLSIKQENKKEDKDN